MTTIMSQFRLELPGFHHLKIEQVGILGLHEFGVAAQLVAMTGRSIIMASCWGRPQPSPRLGASRQSAAR